MAELNELLRRGVELAREGKLEEARRAFEQALELDDRNEKAWYGLARVLRTPEERRFALAQVLRLNPNHENARRMMEQIDSKAVPAGSVLEKEIMPGISRKIALIAAGGIAIVLVAIIGLIALVSGRNAEAAAQDQAATEAVFLQTQVVLDVAASATSAVETAVALVSPTLPPSPTADRPTLPPEFTPTFTPTAMITATSLPAPPGDAGGLLYEWTGQDQTQTGFLYVGVIPMPSGQYVQLSRERSREAALSGDGGMVAYTRFFPSTADWSIELNDINGSSPTQPFIGNGQQFIRAQMPSFCPVQNKLVFVALPLEGASTNISDGANLLYQVYTYDMATQQVNRITNDKTRYTYPVYSKDCTKVAVAWNDINSATPGADLVVLDVQNSSRTRVTNDLNRTEETMPQWSPDGVQLIYTAAPQDNPTNHDIFIRPASGNGAAQALVPDSGGDDLYPIFSPNSSYIAFSSNVGGNYDVFVYDINKGERYQVTQAVENDFVSAWAGR